MPTDEEKRLAKRLNFLVSHDEDLMIRALARAEGLAASAYLRRAVREAFKRYAKESGRAPADVLSDWIDGK